MGEGSRHPSEPQPPPSIAQPTIEEPIPNVVSSSHQKTQTPRQALNKVTELPKTSEPIPNVADKAVYEEWGDRVERASTTAASLDAEQASGNINRAQSTMRNVPLPRGVGAGGSPRCQESMGGGVPLLRLEDQGRFDDETNFDAGFYKDQLRYLRMQLEKNVHAYTRRRRVVSTGSGGISIASRLFSTAKESVSTTGASMPISTAGMVQEVNISILSPVVVKDKGKGKMEESKDKQTKRTKLQQEQNRLGHEATVRLQEELDEEERQMMARVHEAAQSFTEEEWENIKARVKANEELAQRLQAEERNKYSEVGQAKMLVDLINQRKKYFTAQKAKAKRNKPLTQAQHMNYMTNYIKHMGSHTLQQLRGYSFDEIKELFETAMKRVNTFVPKETEVREEEHQKAELDHEGSKRQKTNEASRSVQEQFDEEEKELSKGILMLMLVNKLINDSESDNGSRETPLVSPFPHSVNDSDNEEVLNELSEYENAGTLRRERIISSSDGDDLAFECMIGFRKFTAYLDPFLPMNIISRKAYNTIMVERLEETGKNLVAIVRDVYVFVGSFTYVTNFVILEDIGEFIMSDMAKVLMARPFRKTTKLKYDVIKGLVSFSKIFDTYTYRMPRTIPKIKNFNWSKVPLLFELS
ncbi:hypothetical protein Tco_1105248 [Tanacetum coccineum]